MAEFGGHIDATGGVPAYTAAQDAKFYNLLGEGIIPDIDNELAVIMGVGLQVIIDSGAIISRGYFYIQDEHANGANPLVKPVDAEAAGSNRIDNVVIEFDISAGTFLAKIHKGTGTTGTPVAPALVDTTSKWEVLLAQVYITAGNITNIIDGRVIKGARIADGGVKVTATLSKISGNNQKELNESINAQIISSAERTKLNGIQTGAQVNRAISDSVSLDSSITNASSKAVKTANDNANTREPALAADRKRKITISSGSPSGGSDGDIWLKIIS